MAEWQRVRLSEVTTQSVDTVAVEPGIMYPLLGVRWYGVGAFLRETVDTTTSKARTLYRTTPGQFIYNRLFAYKGSFGLVTPELAGSYVSNEFPLFACDTSRLLPEYLSLYFQQPHVWRDVETESTGTTASRSRWKEARFNAHRVALPPLDAQHRIVDLVGGLDANITALQSEADALQATGAALRTGLLHEADGIEVPLGSLVTFASGYAFSPAHQGRADGRYPFLKVSDMNRPGNETRIVSAANWVEADILATLRARTWPAGTVVFPKVGAALLTEKRRLLARDSAFDNNVMGLVPGPRITSEYLFAVMQEVRLGDFAQPGAVPSINQSHVTPIVVNLPSLAEQDAVTDVLGAAPLCDCGVITHPRSDAVRRSAAGSRRLVPAS